MEEFILRIGANASSLKSELTRTGAWAKAWGTSLAEDMRSKIGRVFMAGFAVDKAVEFGTRILEQVKEKILAIQRAQGELPGVGTNFLQNVFNYLDRIGVSFESASKPLLKFKQLLDDAKLNPGGDALRTLERYNIVTSEADLKTQKYATSLSKLSEAYLKSGKNLKVLEELIGKENMSPAMLALLELGPKKIEDLNSGGFSRTLSPETLAVYKQVSQGAKTGGQQLGAFLGNLLGYAVNHNQFMLMYRLQDKMHHPMDFFKNPRKTFHDIWTASPDKDDAEAQTQQNLERNQQRRALENKETELNSRARELQATKDDQGKVSVDAGEAMARRITGIQAPKIFGLTPRMMTMLNIKTLEENAQNAFLRGDDAGHDRLMAQAQSMRSSNPWLMDKDKNPMAKTEAALDVIKNELADVQEFARMVNKDAKQNKAK